MRRDSGIRVFTCGDEKEYYASLYCVCSKECEDRMREINKDPKKMNPTPARYGTHRNVGGIAQFPQAAGLL
jgi:hypothetical protein